MILETQVSLKKTENDKNILFRKDLSDFENNVATILTQSILVFPIKERMRWVKNILDHPFVPFTFNAQDTLSTLIHTITE